ncbi:FHA domain-containing protein [Chloroflexota bacterium]
MSEPLREAPTLILSQVPGNEGQLDVGGTSITIGRQADCDIQLDHEQISRHHARISWNGTEYVVEDLGSTNGTFVNDTFITDPHPLQRGDVVRLGAETQFTFGESLPLPDATVPVDLRDMPQRSERSERRPMVWALVAIVGLVLVVAVGAGAYYLLSGGGARSSSTSSEAITVDDVSIYPVAERNKQAEADWAELKGLTPEQMRDMVRFYTTSDAPDHVLSYLDKAMAYAGWQTTASGADGTGGEYIWEQPRPEGGLYQVVTSAYLDPDTADKTWIMVLFSSQ